MQTVWYKVANINKNMDEHLTTNSEDHIDETTIHLRGKKNHNLYLYIYEQLRWSRMLQLSYT